MGTTLFSGLSQIASSSVNKDMFNVLNFVSKGTHFMSLFISVGIWVVVGYVLSKKAREVGLSGTLHFCLCFFFHLIGLVISLILIDKRKKDIYMQNMRMNPNPFQNQQYGGYGQPMQQPYGQQGFYGGQYYNQPYGQQTYTGKPMNAAAYCSTCGHQQADGNFCDVCGSRLR